MKKIILFLFIGILTLTFAIDTNDIAKAGFNDLTTQQQAEIVKTIADKTEQAKKITNHLPEVETVEEAQKWVNLGSSIGKGLASSAKELGIAVNEFSNSSVGKLTMFLIIFSIIGNTIVHIAVGLLFMLVGVTATTVLLNRRNRLIVTYHDNGKLKTKQRDELNDGNIIGFWFGYIIIILIAFVIMVTG